MYCLRRLSLACWLPALAWLAGCAVEQQVLKPTPRPDEVRARIVSAMPASVPDRAGWAVDLYAALATLRIEPSNPHVCAVLAVTEQESGFKVDPAVPRLGQIAREEIDRRAERAGVPSLLVSAALQLRSADGRSYADRIAGAKTERDLSKAFEEFIRAVPLGERLLASYNPVRTGGPMQVSIDYAEAHAAAKPYPYVMAGSVRDEVFSRRGGLYFGVAHLLDYPADYDALIYRFADFNAGHHASRNAAFQAAVSVASGIPLELDGDLVRRGVGADQPGSTELAVRTLGPRLGMGDAAIRRALERDGEADFGQSRIFERVFALAEQVGGKALPRAVIPRIKLSSPKITRALTTEWFARRVEERYRRCLAKLGEPDRPETRPVQPLRLD